MEGFREKRRNPRLDTHIPVRYRKLGKREGPKEANTVSKDLSNGGVRFTTDEFVSRACRLVLELNMPMFTKPVKAIGKVAWIRKLPYGDSYEIGNRFLDITKGDRKLLSEYLESLAQYND